MPNLIAFTGEWLRGASTRRPGNTGIERLDGGFSEHGHGHQQLLSQDSEYVLHTFSTADRQAVQAGAANLNGGRAQSEGLDDIGSSANATIYDDRHAASNLF